MIFVGNNRGNGQNLARHLMSDENDHVTLHEISGFASDTLAGAFKEVEALSRGTKCQKYLYSLSLNPPANERVDTEVFMDAISKAEQKLGLEGQARAIVFHEKENRRHCHVVWNRIDVDQMKAINMIYPKRKLMDVSKDLYLEHGWDMPKGFIKPAWRDPKNFTLEQWQQAKRIGQDPRELKAIIQSCWKQSDDRKSLQSALQEHGLMLAKGDRRGYVATDINGEVYALARWTNVKAKDVKARLGDSKTLPSLEQAQAKLAQMVTPVIERLSKQEAQKHKTIKEQQDKLFWHLADKHNQERDTLKKRQDARELKEIKIRQERFNRGLRGLFDRITGTHSKIKKQNELETYQSTKRDQKQRDTLIFKQMGQRRQLAKQSDKVLGKFKRIKVNLEKDVKVINDIKKRQSIDRYR